MISDCRDRLGLVIPLFSPGYVLINLIADVTYTFFDARIRNTGIGAEGAQVMRPHNGLRLT